MHLSTLARTNTVRIATQVMALVLVVLFLRDRLECVADGADGDAHQPAAEHHHPSDSPRSNSQDDSHCPALIAPVAGQTVRPPSQISWGVPLIAAVLPEGRSIGPLATVIWDHGPPGGLLPALLFASSLSERAPPAVA